MGSAREGKGGYFQNFRFFFSLIDWEDDLRLSYREVLLCVQKLIIQIAAAVGFDLFGS
jgi:hypothetical protein